MGHNDSDVEAAAHAKRPPVSVAMVTPAATLLATWGVRRAMGFGYKAMTGRKPPTAQDRTVGLAQVIAWTMVSTAAVAVVEVLVVRAVAHLAED